MLLPILKTLCLYCNLFAGPCRSAHVPSTIARKEYSVLYNIYFLASSTKTKLKNQKTKFLMVHSMTLAIHVIHAHHAMQCIRIDIARRAILQCSSHAAGLHSVWRHILINSSGSILHTPYTPWLWPDKVLGVSAHFFFLAAAFFFRGGLFFSSSAFLSFSTSQGLSAMAERTRL